MRSGHAVADDGQDALPQPDVNLLNLSVAQLRVERPAHRGLGTNGLRLGNGETDGMLGAALRDQDHRNAGIAQSTEQAMRGAGHTDHPGALQIDQRHRIDGGDALHLER